MPARGGRAAFATGDSAIKAGLPVALVAHRDRMYEKHLGLHVAL